MRKILLIALLPLAACGEMKPAPDPKHDLAKEHLFFVECLKALPQAQRYKYLGDAVEACETAAAHLSVIGS